VLILLDKTVKTCYCYNQMTDVKPVLKSVTTYPMNQSIVSLKYSGNFSRIRQYSSAERCGDHSQD